MHQVVMAFEIPEAVLQHPDAARILKQRPIHLHSTGQAKIKFDVAHEILRDADFLGALQSAYAAMLPDGEKPEFVVVQTQPGHFAYENRYGEKTDIEQMFRQITQKEASVYLLSKGERFFGTFEAITAIEIRRCANDSVDWNVQVLAWPHNRFSRLIARTGVVNRFFRSKTSEITDLAVNIGMYLTPGGGT